MLSTLWFIVLVADTDEYLRGRSRDESTAGAARKTGRPDRDQPAGLTGGTSALSFSCLLPSVALHHRVLFLACFFVFCFMCLLRSLFLLLLII